MINRNNYEEYFLLLADNELSPEEAIAVKLFAAKHPDLAEELDILMSCRLEVDPMPAFPKEKLLRTTLWNAETPEPIHTQMLLMLDGELTGAEKQQLEARITANKALQTEWQTLQQTKLVAEAITHPNKESLHRTNRKVRPLLWVRWAAAAAVVGLGWFFWTQHDVQIARPSNTLAVSASKQENSKNVQPQTIATPQPDTEDRQPAITPQIAAVESPVKTNSTSRQSSNQPAEPKESNVANDNNTILASSTGDENNATETEPAIARLSSTNISLGNDDIEIPTQVAQLSAKPLALQITNTSQKATVFTGSKSEMPVEEDEYITVGGARINKHKMRGLFRNVTRSVARSFSKSKMEPDVYATR